MDIDIDKLKTAAQAATPGEWRISMRASYRHYQVSSMSGIRIVMTTDAIACDADPSVREANAEFIAAANPAVVSELVRRLKAAEEKPQSRRSIGPPMRSRLSASELR